MSDDNPRGRFRNDPDPRRRFADVFINGEPVVTPLLLPKERERSEKERPREEDPAEGLPKTAGPPTSFELHIENHESSNYVRVWWDGDKLEYQAVAPFTRDRLSERLSYAPSTAVWGRFWSKCDRLGVWDWHDYGCRTKGGSEWSLVLESGDRTTHSSGIEAFPPDGGGDLDHLSSFCSAVSALVDGKPVDAFSPPPSGRRLVRRETA